MKNNKKLAIAGVSALGLAAVGFGAFAFFSDTAEQDTTGTVGTVDVTNTGKLELDNAGNINPGDEDPTVPEGSTPGTSHKLSFGVKNQGNKSIVTRNIIEISVDSHFDTDEDGRLVITDDTNSPVLDKDGNPAKDKDGNPIYNKKYTVVYPDGSYKNLDPSIFALYAKVDGENVPIEETTSESYKAYKDEVFVRGTKDGKVVNVAVADKDDRTKIDAEGQRFILRYVIQGATLHGVGDAAENNANIDGATSQPGAIIKDNVTGADYEYYLGMKKETEGGAALDGMSHNDKYQGSHLTIDLEVQAMQNRNTQAGDYYEGGSWETVYKDTFKTGGTASN